MKERGDDSGVARAAASQRCRELLAGARFFCSKMFSASKFSAQVSRYRIANFPVAISFNETSFFQALAPALKHLCAYFDEDPELTLFVLGPEWWKETLGSGPNMGDSNPTLNEGFFFDDPTGLSAIFASGAFSSISLFFPERKTAFYAASSLEAIPGFEQAAPFRTILYWALRVWGKQAIHAACVGTESGGVLIAGRGGTGKSCTSLTALKRGMMFLGDDYVMIDASQDPPMAYSLFSSAKLNVLDRGRFPDFGALWDDFGGEQIPGEKAVVCLSEAFGPQMASMIPLRAILIPEITGGVKTERVPIDRASALRELAPTALFQFPGAGQQDFQRMAELVRKLPCHRLRIGTDSDSLVETLRSFCHH